MKTFKSSDLTHNRAAVFKEAEKDGVIIQLCRTNGDVIQEFVLLPKLYRVGESSTESGGCFADLLNDCAEAIGDVISEI